MGARLRTLNEVLDKAEELTATKELVDFDRDLVKAFDLGTIKGTVKQLTFVLQALRPAAIFVSGAAIDSLDNFDIPKSEEDEDADDKPHYDA